MSNEFQGLINTLSPLSYTVHMYRLYEINGISLEYKDVNYCYQKENKVSQVIRVKE